MPIVGLLNSLSLLAETGQTAFAVSTLVRAGADLASAKAVVTQSAGLVEDAERLNSLPRAADLTAVRHWYASEPMTRISEREKLIDVQFHSLRQTDLGGKFSDRTFDVLGRVARTLDAVKRYPQYFPAGRYSMGYVREHDEKTWRQAGRLSPQPDELVIETPFSITWPLTHDLYAPFATLFDLPLPRRGTHSIFLDTGQIGWQAVARFFEIVNLFSMDGLRLRLPTMKEVLMGHFLQGPYSLNDHIFDRVEEVMEGEDRPTVEGYLDTAWDKFCCEGNAFEGDDILKAGLKIVTSKDEVLDLYRRGHEISAWSFDSGGGEEIAMVAGTPQDMSELQIGESSESYLLGGISSPKLVYLTRDGILSTEFSEATRAPRAFDPYPTIRIAATVALSG